MSSATSIEELAAASAKVDASFKPWHFFVLAALLAATVAVLLARQASPGHVVLISLLIGACGVAAAGFYRMLAPFATGDTALTAERLSERARTALEREKALTLRSIKELEFDRAMGKLSDSDFEQMAGRLRARAIALMRELDRDPSGYRDAIERELAARLEGAALAGPSTDAARSCAGCGTRNDLDAIFCKRCGARLPTSPADGGA